MNSNRIIVVTLVYEEKVLNVVKYLWSTSRIQGKRQRSVLAKDE